MKLNLSFIFILIVTVYISSCTKENTDSPYANDSIQLIKSVTEYYNGTRQQVTSFTYDTSGRLVKAFYNELYEGRQYYDTLVYTASSITMSTYDNKNKFLEQEVFTINENNLAILMTDTLGDNKKSAKRSFIDLNLMESEANIYGYDANGYQNLEITTNEFGGTHRYDKTYSGGNLVSSIYQYMANDTVIQNGSTALAYFLDNNNTIGNENRGVPFLGKQNKNLLKSVTDMKWSTGDTLSITTNYRYEFDSRNRVVKQYITPKNGDIDDVTYLAFIYR